ncbi:MAG: exonuclease SbcC [Salinibacterium sp.]|nr:exonuclease SbcC [Salinibacterium sp.]
MPSGAGDFELTMDDLRVVARYAVESAQGVLPLFEEANPEDPRPRAGIEAAWAFANGASRTRLQRVTAMDAHRAAKEAASEASKHAALAAGDAAAAAYLHPLAKATQIGHILRAAANAARAAQLSAGDDSNVGDVLIEQARERATPALIDVLRRYAPAPLGNSRVAIMMKNLDTALRA